MDEHRPGDSEILGATDFNAAATGCGSRTKGLVVDQTLLVALRR